MNADTEPAADAIELVCAECGQSFSICRSCWRCQKYCGEVCGQSAKLKRSRERQRRYAQTDKGLEFGRLRQRRRYEKIKSFKSSH